MAFYRKKPVRKALKRKFTRWAKSAARPTIGWYGRGKAMGAKLGRARNINGNRDVLKVRMTRTIRYGDMLAGSDGSRSCNIFFCPSRNISTAFSGGNCNLFYHPDFGVMQELYQQYKVSCVVMKFSKPDQYIRDSTNSTVQFIKMPTQEWGTQILHSRLCNKPDTTTGAMQLQADITPRVQIYTPSTYAEAVDDGARRFKIVPNYKRSETRVYKPSSFYEKKWTNKLYDDLELAKGGIHIRIKKGSEPVPEVAHLDVYDQQIMFDVTATVYMNFKERV